MGTYSQSSLDLVCRLIHRDNPQIETPLSSENVMLLSGPFTSGLGSSGRNTRVLLNGKTGSGIVGKKEFFYDRIDIGKLFNGITVVFTAKGEAATVVDLLPALNEQYGLGLTAEDITNGSTKLGTGYSPTPVTITISSLSVAYRGSLSVVWTREPVGIYPDSGPGSKVLLIGSEDAGYFGMVSQEELLGTYDILDTVFGGEVISGVSITTSTTWYWAKFFYHGEIIYYPSVVLMGSASWQDIYTFGAVYDDDTEGLFPPADVDPVKQQRLVHVNKEGRDYYLSLGLPALSKQDPVDFTQLTVDGMGADLFSKVFYSANHTTPEWDNLSGWRYDDVQWWQTTSVDARNLAWAQNLDGSRGASEGTVKTAKSNWRPFLRLRKTENLTVALQDFQGTASGALRRPRVTISPEVTDVLRLLSDVSWEIRGALNKPLVNAVAQPLLGASEYSWERLDAKPVLMSFTTTPVLILQQYTWHRPLRSPVVQISAEYREVIPTDLGTLIGDLDGFN